MKTTKYLIAAAVVTAALPFLAKANTITYLGEFTSANQSPSTILALMNANGGDSGVAPDDMDLLIPQSGGMNDGRLGSTGTLVNDAGTFTVTAVADPGGHGTVYELSFQMNPGFVLAGVALHGAAGQTENMWAINDETMGTNEGLFHTALAGKSGTYGGLSNFDIFVESVPDGGTTLIMFGAAMVGLVGFRRYFAQASI
jgi:hypothetical protein